MKIEKLSFGQTKDGKQVDLYVLTNQNGMLMKVTNYGAIVTSLHVPDKSGNSSEIVLGFDKLDDYMTDAYLEGCPYLGAIVGRYGNRIAKGKFTLEGKDYSLFCNDGENHLHGGKIGFDKVVWDAEEITESDRIGVKLTYFSKDMEEGYPGNFTISVLYSVTNNNELRIEYSGTTDKPCPVNPTHHGYFNLNGNVSDVLDHEVMINADKYTAVDKGLIPTSELVNLNGSPLDFSKAKAVGLRIDKVEGGFDHNFVLNKEGCELSLAASVFEPVSGRAMEVFTTEPGVQFYSGNFLDGTFKRDDSFVFHKHSGFCFETQHFPDSPNQPTFPNTVLKLGEEYKQLTIYRFSVKD